MIHVRKIVWTTLSYTEVQKIFTMSKIIGKLHWKKEYKQQQHAR